MTILHGSTADLTFPSAAAERFDFSRENSSESNCSSQSLPVFSAIRPRSVSDAVLDSSVPRKPRVLHHTRLSSAAADTGFSSCLKPLRSQSPFVRLVRRVRSRSFSSGPKKKVSFADEQGLQMLNVVEIQQDENEHILDDASPGETNKSEGADEVQAGEVTCHVANIDGHYRKSSVRENLPTDMDPSQLVDLLKQRIASLGCGDFGGLGDYARTRVQRVSVHTDGN